MRPRFSLVILVLEQVDDLRNCLDSVFQNNPGQGEIEVVVIANGTDPRELEKVELREGLRIITVPSNLGFSGGCNLGARFAKGDHLVFLNDDTTVEPGWLDALGSTAEANDRIGAVCCRLVDWDGRLQEAGAVLWRNARTDRVGKGASREDPRYLIERDVDCASACGLLVQRRAWNAVGGFDERFFPAYYEDIDLCLSLRARGYRVVYEPKAVVRHHGSASTTYELGEFSGVLNGQLFMTKWADELLTRARFPGDDSLAEQIAQVIENPPTPKDLSPHNDLTSTTSEPTQDEIRELSLVARQKEVGFKAAFAVAERRGFKPQLTKSQWIKQLIGRIPGLRSLWKRVFRSE